MVLGFYANMSITGLNAGRLEPISLLFKFPARHHVCFLQSLIGNYDIGALSRVSFTPVTAASREFRYVYRHASNAYWLKMLRLS